MALGSVERVPSGLPMPDEIDVHYGRLYLRTWSNLAERGPRVGSIPRAKSPCELAQEKMGNLRSVGFDQESTSVSYQCANWRLSRRLPSVRFELLTLDVPVGGNWSQAVVVVELEEFFDVSGR